MSHKSTPEHCCLGCLFVSELVFLLRFLQTTVDVSTSLSCRAVIRM